MEDYNEKMRLHKLGAELVWWFFFIWDLLKLLLYTIYCYLEAFYRIFVPPPLKSLAGERILITGAGNGIGREICLQLARSGATLICWDIDKRANEKLLRDLKELGAKAYIDVVDISDRNKVEEAASKIKASIGDVTIVINNAAIMPVHPFLSHNPRELERLFQINVLGQFWILREVLPSMIAKNKGHIVTTCSIAGLIGTRNMVPYCGTKHAVHGYIEALKDELQHMPRKPNINFTTVYPYAVNTNLMTDVKCQPTVPSLFNVLEPQDVATRLIDGMRRNYEHVYVPKVMKTFGLLNSVLLPKVKTASNDIFSAHVEPVQ